MGLSTTDLNWDGRITDVDEGTVDKSAGICGREDETACHNKINKDEGRCGTIRGGGVISGTDKFIVGCGGSSPQWQ